MLRGMVGSAESAGSTKSVELMEPTELMDSVAIEDDESELMRSERMVCLFRARSLTTV